MEATITKNETHVVCGIPPLRKKKHAFRYKPVSTYAATTPMIPAAAAAAPAAPAAPAPTAPAALAAA